MWHTKSSRKATKICRKLSDCKIDFYCIKSFPIPTPLFPSKWKIMAVPTFLWKPFAEYILKMLLRRRTAEKKHLKCLSFWHIEEKKKYQLKLVFAINQSTDSISNSLHWETFNFHSLRDYNTISWIFLSFDLSTETKKFQPRKLVRLMKLFYIFKSFSSHLNKWLMAFWLQLNAFLLQLIIIPGVSVNDKLSRKILFCLLKLSCCNEKFQMKTFL